MSTQWPHPRYPLPPHRLAKLANALGVSTPVPATHPFMQLSHSTTNTQHSKFLLHVIPPLNSDLSSSDLTPLPSNASGYHTQFRRGTLVPFHPTLQSQLSAIAKEYALPSTTGLILYLILSTEQPGPRLSEDIWKHLWARVLHIEPDDSPSPFIHGLGITLPAQSSHDLISKPIAFPFTPGSSSPSSPSDIRSHSAPPSSSLSKPPTPDPSKQQADRLHLPGLHSPSIIPILAKVEFDIDPNRAGWYQPWLRSRRMNHAKRAESQMSRRRALSRAGDDGSITGESETVGSADERKPPLDLKLLAGTQTPSPAPSFVLSVKDDLSEDEVILGPYGRISDSPDQLDSHSDDELDQESTTRLAPSNDPLEDIFGTDEDTWADLHAVSDRRSSVRPKDPYVLDLALNPAELAALPDDRLLTDEYEEDPIMREENEVNELLAAMSRPLLSVSIPSSPSVNNDNRGSSPTTAGSSRKQAPPRLVIHGLPNNLPQPSSTDSSSPLPPSGVEGTHLAYLRSGTSVVDESYDTIAEEAAFQKTRSPLDDRRGGAVFEDLDLGLEDSEANIEFDENDPDDHRKSQYLMKAQLDELEKHLAEFSPRRLKTDLDDTHHSPGFPSLSPHSGTKNTDVFPLTPGLATGFPSQDEPEPSPPQATWPAIPFSSLAASEVAGATNALRPNDHARPNPRLVVNSDSPPKPSSQDGGSSTDNVSKETAVRKRELEEQASYPALMPPLRLRDTSPIIPLSPDPFGRYPSHIDTTISGSRRSSVYWESTSADRSTPSSENPPQRGGTPIKAPHEQPRFSVAASRFSADSDVTTDTSSKTTNRSTLMTIKKLWRKSNKSSISAPLPPPPAAVLSPPPASPRPSEEFEAPKPLKSTRSPSPLHGNWPPKPKTESSLDNFHFDQESPYPVRRPSHSSPRPPTIVPLPSTTAPPPPAPVPPTSKSFSAPSTPSIPAPTPSSPAPSSAHPISDKEREKSAPKSILRKSMRSQSSSSSSTSDARPSLEKSAPREFTRLRRANGRLSATPDIPPSPPIPEQFVQRVSSEDPRLSVRSKRTLSSSMDAHSPPQARPSRLPPVFPPRRSSSFASSRSRASEESHPSFDASQFEIVSSKVDSTLSYPYHGLDHD